ncbi:hypothetical protein [Nostoc sp.]
MNLLKWAGEVRGKSLGWKLGQPRQRRIRYPVVRKTTNKPRKQQPESA